MQKQINSGNKQWATTAELQAYLQEQKNKGWPKSRSIHKKLLTKS